MMMQSCYIHKIVVGEGAQQGLTVKATQLLAGGASDYEVVVKHSFIDGLLSFITSGIYNPTTVEVKR